jgi:hypothetical protein
MVPFTSSLMAPGRLDMLALMSPSFGIWAVRCSTTSPSDPTNWMTKGAVAVGGSPATTTMPGPG